MEGRVSSAISTFTHATTGSKARRPHEMHVTLERMSVSELDPV